MGINETFFTTRRPKDMPRLLAACQAAWESASYNGEWKPAAVVELKQAMNNFQAGTQFAAITYDRDEEYLVPSYLQEHSGLKAKDIIAIDLSEIYAAISFSGLDVSGSPFRENEFVYDCNFDHFIKYGMRPLPDSEPTPEAESKPPSRQLSELQELQNKLEQLSFEIQNDHGSTFDTEQVMRQLDEVSETIRLSRRYPRPPELDPDIPWSESAEPEYDFDPYSYNGMMSLEDFEQAQALHFAASAEAPQAAPSRKTIYVCSPLAGEIEANIRKAREYSRFVARQGATPIAPHITELFDDAVPEERKLGLEMGLDYLRKADELWVFGNQISDGMAAEIELAQKELNIPIYHVGAPPYEAVPFEFFEKGELTMAQNNQTGPITLESLGITMSVSRDPIDNRCALYFADGDTYNLRGSEWGVDFPSMTEAEAHQFIQTNLHELELLRPSRKSPNAELEAKATERQEVIGITTYANGERREFTDREAFIATIAKELPYRATSGFQFKIITNDAETRKAVDDLVYNEFGEINSRPPEAYDRRPKSIVLGVSSDAELDEQAPDAELDEQASDAVRDLLLPGERFCAQISYKGPDKKIWKTEYYFDREMYEAKIQENTTSKVNYKTRLLKRPELFRMENIGCVAIQHDSRIKGNQCVVTTGTGKKITIRGEDHNIDFRLMPPLSVLKFFDAHPQLMNPPEEAPKEAATKPKEAATEPKEAVTEPKEAATEPKEAATEPKEAATEPKEAATEPKEAATEPDEEAATEPDEEAATEPYTFQYRLLSRLCSDCDYFLGAGQRHEKHLWTGNVKAHIAKMRELYHAVPEKPEWLTEQDIDRYEKQMTGAEAKQEPSPKSRTEPAGKPVSHTASPDPTKEPASTIAPHRATNFTQDQLQRAKEVDLLNYLQTHGYTVKEHGAAYKVQLNGHDSDTVFPDTNSWYSFRTGEGRDIVDWLVKRENKTMVQAVQELTGETFDPQKLFRKKREAAEPKPLELPQVSENQRRMFAYLLKTRKLDQALVKKCVDDGLLYQGITTTRKEDKEYQFENCCFVGKDDSGVPKSVMLRSMNSEGRMFKGNASGSDREYGWMLPGKPDAKHLTVCESPIEALSVATLHKQRGEAWDNEHYLSLNGITEADKSGALMERALQRILDAHPEIDTINIALNNDQNAPVNHGKIVGEQLKRLFGDRYQVVESYPQLKDYNDELRNEVAAREHAKVELPPKAASNRHSFQYLTQQKQLDATLVREWIADGKLYQSDKPVTVNEKEGNDSQTVFVERDKSGAPTYAMGVYLNYRTNKADFKRDYRSEEATGNHLTIPGSNHTLMVFNNPISMLAHQSYLREQNMAGENNYLCCLRDPAGAVREYLEKRPDITAIKVMLDEARSFNKENQLVDYRELSFQKIKKTFASRQISVERKYPKGIDLSRDLVTLKQRQNQAAPTSKNENGLEMER